MGTTPSFSIRCQYPKHVLTKRPEQLSALFSDICVVKWFVNFSGQYHVTVDSAR